MPYDGSGNFNRVHDWTADEAVGIKIRADRFDAENDDFATAFENCITRDGQGKPSANLDFNNKKITNLADPTTLTGALNVRTAQQDAYSFGTTAGGTTVYTLALGITVASLVDGQPFRAEINATNTGSSTLNVDSFGAKTIKADGQDLVGGELVAGSIYTFAYNAGTGFIDLQKPANATETLKGIVELATSAETITGTSQILATHPLGVTSAIANSLALFGGKYNLTLENDSGDTQHDIKVNSGICTDSTNTVIMNFTSSTIIKRIDANWVEGNGNGGFPSGISLTGNTIYYFFLISKTDGTIDAGFDSSLTATNLLSDASAYTYYRRIGAVAVDGSSNIRQFKQFGNAFRYIQPVNNLTDSSPAIASNTNLSVTVPTGITIEAYVKGIALTGTTGADALIVSFGSTFETLDSTNFSMQCVGDANRSDAVLKSIITNTAQIKYSVFTSATNRTLYFYTYGWNDFFLD